MTLEAQAEKITTLEQLAQALLAQDHYASDLIKSRCNGVVGRMQKVQQAADQRRAKLIESRNYQQFLGNVYEVLLDGFLWFLFHCESNVVIFKKCELIMDMF